MFSGSRVPHLANAGKQGSYASNRKLLPLISSENSAPSMSSQPAPQPKVVFDAFEFSPASGELRKHGRVVRLQGQPIQILETLLYEPGQLVTP